MYTVSSGDTLSGIAAALWGDASLWYKIAEVNGLTSDASLVEGQPLIIPVGVVRTSNNASTFQPYDPLEVLGATSPTAAKPPKDKAQKCGGLGQILLVVIAVAVTIATQGALAKATSGIFKVIGSNAIAAGATSAAAGSIVSQGVGVATGIQDKFSWNAVALAAIGGGVGGATSGIGNAFVRGALSSAITQGIGVATGLQDTFSWAGVAAAGVGAAVGSRFGGDDFGARLVRGTASAIANAATRSLIEGSDFGDNIIAALPDVIGQTIGNAVAGRIAGSGRGGPRSAQELYDRAADGLEPLSAVDGAYNLAGEPVAGARRSTGFFEAIGDFLGFDGSFGYNGPTFAPLSMANLGGAFSGNGPVDADVIVVTGQRTHAPAAPGSWYTPPPSSWMQNIQALGSEQRWPSEYERNYPEGMAPRWTAGPSQFDLWQQRQTQLGMQGIANSMTGTGAVFQFGAGVAGADYEDQVRWGALGAGLEGVAGGMYGTPALNRGRYNLSPYAIEYDQAAVNGMWRTPANPINISTAGMTAAERASAIEYAQRTNAWLGANGPTTVQSTAGTLRSQASSAARTERLRAERAGTPYQGQAGHVPDTALTGSAQPPAGWLDMAGTSNNVIGGGLSSRIGQPVGIITVDGKVP